MDRWMVTEMERRLDGWISGWKKEELVKEETLEHVCVEILWNSPPGSSAIG